MIKVQLNLQPPVCSIFLLPSTTNTYPTHTCFYQRKHYQSLTQIRYLSLTTDKNANMSDSPPSTPKAATGIAALSVRETEVLGKAWSCLKTGPPEVSSMLSLNIDKIGAPVSCRQSASILSSSLASPYHSLIASCLYFLRPSSPFPPRTFTWLLSNHSC